MKLGIRVLQLVLRVASQVALPLVMLGQSAFADNTADDNAKQLPAQVDKVFQQVPALKALSQADSAAYDVLINKVLESSQAGSITEIQLQQIIEPVLQQTFLSRLGTANDRLIVNYYKLLLKRATRSNDLNNCFGATATADDASRMQQLVVDMLATKPTGKIQQKSDAFDATLHQLVGAKAFAEMYTKLLGKQPLNCQEQYWLYQAAIKLPPADAAATLRSFHPKK